MPAFFCADLPPPLLLVLASPAVALQGEGDSALDLLWKKKQAEA
jgi:hypothetical protein